MTAPAVAVNAADARGLAFSCRPGCGFCCTANPLVQDREAPALGPLVVRAEDGTLRIPLKGPACSALRADMMCGVYENRPSVCHLYPYQVHAGRRVQVSISLGCPGVEAAASADGSAEDGARRAAGLALAQPEAAAMAARARETFAEFDRRMKEWGVHASPDRLRAGFLPHVETLARPAMLPAFFAGLEPGDLLLDGNAAARVGALFETEAEADLTDILAQAAADAFDEPDTVIWVEPDFSWTTAKAEREGVKLLRHKEGKWAPARRLDVEALPTDWSDEARAVLADYLRRLLHRDHTEGAAAWLVDASGYQATLPAAYGRVLGEAALQVALRAGLLAAEAGAEQIDAAFARRGVAAYETAYHSLPTLGSVL